MELIPRDAIRSKPVAFKFIAANFCEILLKKIAGRATLTDDGI
jgi:hypothetical protein